MCSWSFTASSKGASPSPACPLCANSVKKFSVPDHLLYGNFKIDRSGT
jgi:hypothetical protein